MKNLLIAALVAMSTSAHAVTVYTADFTGTAGFEHSSSNAPAAGPQTLDINNFTIGYENTPATDGSRNFFETTGTSLISSDFGGDHFFRTAEIDVSGFTSATIDIVNGFVGTDSFNASSEFIEYGYSLDGGSEQSFFRFDTTPNASDLNATTGIDVSSANVLVVAISATVNGAGDGWELSSLTVDATGASTIPLPATLPLMVMGLAAFGVLRARRV